MRLNRICIAYIIRENWDPTALKAVDSLDHVRPVTLVEQTANGRYEFVHNQLVTKGLAEKIVT